MFHKEGLNIILSTFVIIAILIIALDYFEVKKCSSFKNILDYNAGISFTIF